MTPDDPIDVDADFSDDDILDSDIQDDTVDGEYDYDADDNWDDADTTDAKPVKQKKKSSLFTIGVVGAAVLIGGGIMVHQLKGKAPADQTAPLSQEQVATATPEQTPPATDPSDLAAIQQNTDDAQQVPAPTPAPAHAAPAQGFMNDPSQLSDASNATAPAQPAPALPDAPSMTGFSDQPAAAAPTPAPADLPVAEANPNLPNINAIKKADVLAQPATAPVPASAIEPTPAPAPAAVTPAPVAAVPTPAPVETASTAPTAREAELQAKLDEALQRIAALEKKLEEKPAPTNAMTPSDSEEIASLRSDMQRLESKFNQITVNPAVAPSGETYVAKPVVKKAPAKKKKKKSEPSYSNYSSYKAPAAATGKWELRSARPGEAMVAKPGTAELKTIRVGDSVVGIGQIKSISQIGNTWVVQGTSGSITQ